MRIFKQIIFCSIALIVWCCSFYSILSFAQIQPLDPAKKKPVTMEELEKRISERQPEDAAAPVENNSSVEVDADKFEYGVPEETVIAEGNVKARYQGATLTCDELQLYRPEKVGVAKGNIILETPQATVYGDKMTYNFETQTGTFGNARIVTPPFFAGGQSVSKVEDNHFTFNKAYVTTCDHDKPHFRLQAESIDIYPQDRVEARKVTVYLGPFPIVYLAKMTQRIDDKRPILHVTPGYSKDWGFFFLSQLRLKLNEYVKGALLLDYRERKDVASGIDLNYKTPKIGDGVLKLYYMNERNISSERIWDERLSPTIERERYKAEWRHKWKIDKQTEFIAQYYRLSDVDFLKDYFERQHREDPNPATFFIFTKSMAKTALSVRAQPRVNRFNSAVEYLPEIKYDVFNQEIGATNLYFKSASSYANLTRKQAAPSDNNEKTDRFDTDNQVSYPMKISFLEFKPYVGGQVTYYTRTVDPDDYRSTRTIFKTGADLTTKFSRVFDVHGSWAGIDINRLRHIITPSVAYQFVDRPSIDSDRLDQYDSVDNITKSNKFSLSLENKLQTKREDKKVDILRVVGGVDFLLENDPNDSGFFNVTSEWDVRPTDWLTIGGDTAYDPQGDRLVSGNFDVTIHDLLNEKWYFTMEKRYNREVDDQITTQLGYIINPKWKFTLYDRFDIDGGQLKEQQYVFTRDMHEWEMDIQVNDKHNDATEFYVVFRLKAFPDIRIEGGKSFNEPRRNNP